MELNDLLRGKGINPERVIVMRHRPVEPTLNRVMPWLSVEKPEVFNAYQRSHGKLVEKALQHNVAYVASFLGREPGTALFVGVYAVASWKPITLQEFWSIHENTELRALGMREDAHSDRTSLIRFDLRLTDVYAQWKGKLVVGWPGGERAWWRRAHRNKMPVVAILPESALDSALPEWDEMDLTWEELSVIPARLQAKLSEWRAIYYIFDTSDGKGYVGSAYGTENLLARWRDYGAVGHGGNRLLRQRDPHNFRFTILQRVSPDLDAADVTRLESTWKERLHTRAPFGLNDN